MYKYYNFILSPIIKKKKMSQPTPLASDSRPFQMIPLLRQAPHHRPLILIFSLFQTSEPNTKFHKNTANRFYANCEWNFHFNPPRPFGWKIFAFLALYRPTDYVYKIWFSLVQGQEFSFFDPPPILGGQFLHFQLSIGPQIMYTKFG